MTQVAAPSTPSIWSVPAFQVLIASTWFQSLGNKIYTLALPLLVFELTQSSEWMGWMRAVEFLPNLLLALFIGVWVDRFNRKLWSLAMLAGQVVLFVATFFIVRESGQMLWLLFPIAFLIYACNYGFGNAKMGMLKQAVPDSLQSMAIARLSGVHNVLDALGPTLSGLLLLVTLYTVPMAIVGVLLCVALLTLTLLPWQEPDKPGSTKQPVFVALADGWQALKRNRPMMIITALVVVINTTAGVFDIQAIYAAKALLNLNALQIGLMMSVAGACALLGSVVAPYVRERCTLGKTLLVCVFLEGVFIALPSLQLTLWTLGAALALTSLVGVVANICIWSYRQESTPSEYLGRVAGITGSLFKLGLPFGLAASGYLVSAFGVQQVFFGCAVVQMVAILCVVPTRVRALK